MFWIRERRREAGGRWKRVQREWETVFAHANEQCQFKDYQGEEREQSTLLLLPEVWMGWSETADERLTAILRRVHAGMHCHEKKKTDDCGFQKRFKETVINAFDSAQQGNFWAFAAFTEELYLYDNSHSLINRVCGGSSTDHHFTCREPSKEEMSLLQDILPLIEG